ncbi:hypothetical protein HYH03_017964 [Edaphochlamys debaryana]|uniref:Uncharacterized protein n=1 Tax=Edaphochlamys debaryana TaxID=47281 RepID=A0A835XHG4_9CHLO|nr:hypothetical protein HYH03_017964 [Edaphochlamys debaryana]|eukprot:KAG2483172.1 hypothetical protein HYH03_017964 [Edaphochlamys debaryana]
MTPPSDPVADVWRSPQLLGCVASFLDPSHAAWSFIRVYKAATAAAFGDSSGQLVPRTVRLSWVLSQESLEGAMVAAGLSPPPQEVLIAAASAGRLGVCRWLVEGLGCPGLFRLACLCLISAAGPGPGVVEEARAWLSPAARGGCSPEQEAQAASGDVEAVKDSVAAWSGWRPGDTLVQRLPWLSALQLVQARRDLEQCANAGHAEAVRFLLSRGARPRDSWPHEPAFAAARNGHVGVLQALHEVGCMGDPARCFREGLEGGSLPVVEWLVGTFAVQALSVVEINLGVRTLKGRGSRLSPAARSGSVQLVKALPGLLGTAGPGWVRCREVYWANAAASGCEEAVEWLAKEAGVPNAAYWGYFQAVAQGDLSMVQRLRKLGCPYSTPDFIAFKFAASRVTASAAALPWLEEPGCPASWGAAAAEADAEAVLRAAEEVVPFCCHLAKYDVILVAMLKYGSAMMHRRLIAVLGYGRSCLLGIGMALLAFGIGVVLSAAPPHKSRLRLSCLALAALVFVVLAETAAAAAAAGCGHLVPVRIGAAVLGGAVVIKLAIPAGRKLLMSGVQKLKRA